MHLCWCELWSVSCNISFTHSFTFTVCLHYIIPIGTKKLKCRVGGNYFDVIITLLRVYFFTSSSEKWNIYMRIYITYNILWGLLMIWLDLILLSFLWSIICWYMRFEGWGEYQLLWGSLKSSSRPPLLPEFSQWSPFLGWGRFAFLYCSSCPYYQGTLCPAASGNSGFHFFDWEYCSFQLSLHSASLLLSPLILVFIWAGVSSYILS